MKGISQGYRSCSLRRFLKVMIPCGFLLGYSLSGLAQPIPDFEANVVAACMGTPVTFTNKTENITGIATYLWNFGTGASPATSNVPDPVPVFYSIAGPVTISLSVTDETGNVTVTKTDYITVDGEAPSFTLCPDLPLYYACDPGQCHSTVDYSSLVAVNGSPEPALTYTFSGATEGSGSGTGSGSVFNLGNTIVEITATNTCSSTATCSFIIIVNTPPVADAGDPYEICEGSDLALNGTGSSDPDAACGDWVMSYGWDIDNDGYSDLFESQPVLTYASLVGYGLGTGEHTIRLAAGDAVGGVSYDYTTITINALPSPITGTTSICEGSSATLSSATPDGTWSSLNTDVAAVDATGVVTGVAEGSADIRYTISTGCYVTATVTVIPLPAVTIGALPAACVDAVAFTLTQGSPAGGIYSGQGITNGTTGLFDPSVAGVGTHTITYTFTEGTTGCTANATNTITVNALPTITISTSPACSTDLLTYTLEVTVSSGAVTSSGGTATDLGGNVWSISGVDVGTDITVTVTDANSCDNSVSVTSPDCSCPVVTAPVSGGNQSYCAGESIPSLTVTVGAGETADWYSDTTGGTLLLSGNTSYTPPVPGTYYAESRVTANNCVSSTRTAVILTENPLPTVTLGVLPSICIDADPITLTQGSPAGGIYSGQGITNGTTGLFDPSVAGVGTHTITYTFTEGTTGCTANATNTITVSICTKTLNLTLFLEGLYDGANGLVKTQECIDGENAFDLFAGNISDTLTVELAQDVYPYNTVFLQHGVPISTEGTISLTTIPGDLSGNYFIVIKHRNHIETWSQSTSFEVPSVSYDFADALDKAWGNNMVQVGSIYCIYTGDTDYDQYVGLTDLYIPFNLYKQFSFGYQVSDINADGFVDLNDLYRVFNNYKKGVGMNTPLAPL